MKILKNDFLPINLNDIKNRGWKQLDFICITGDAYIDHPSFGIAVISRVLEFNGFKVGIIARPNIHKDDDFFVLGKPKYAFLVTSGNIDSMVSNYTVSKKKRNKDIYSPNNSSFKRPDRALTLYCKKLRELFNDTPIIIGGLEASLRRFAHYDYWADTIMPSILIDTTANILVYGMGENQIVQIANRLKNGENINDINNIRGTCYLSSNDNLPKHSLMLPSYNDIIKYKQSYAKSCKIQYQQQDYITGETLIETYGEKAIVQLPPMKPLNTNELDIVYSLPYTRTFHPIYLSMDGVSAIEEVEFSIIHNRGCFGGCNFCSLAFHQGRVVTSRSKNSIIEEAKGFINNKNFKGYINDVGGPTANFRNASCLKQKEKGMCKNKKCLTPNPCPSLEVSHKEYFDILEELSKIKGIKKVFVRSGIRFDYLMLDKDESIFFKLIKNHISGQLKVAPEHCSQTVLSLMGKPNFNIFENFTEKFKKINKQLKKQQFLVPYLMSSHPGSTLNDAIKLALYLKKTRLSPEQVQDFYPTPGTISTCMFYTGINPIDLKPVYVPKTAKEKSMQRALLQYKLPENRILVLEALKLAKREDLIGFKPNCLIKPDTNKKEITYKINKKTKKIY